MFQYAARSGMVGYMSRSRGQPTMSYDLFFRTDREPPTADALRAWLLARPHVSVTGSVAAFRDEATGVSFQF